MDQKNCIYRRKLSEEGHVKIGKMWFHIKCAPPPYAIDELLEYGYGTESDSESLTEESERVLTH